MKPVIPRSLEDIREVLGEAAIARLLLAYAGMEIKIPQRVDSGHPLARAIGLDAASKLAEHASGLRIYIPAAAARAERDLSIANARLAGDSVEEIARRHGLTARYVARILARPWRET